jgi:site-specific recombinase XerD
MIFNSTDIIMETKELLETFRKDMQIRNFSGRTIENYCARARMFLEYFRGKDVGKLSFKQIKQYLYYLIKEKSNGASSLKCTIGALKNFYTFTLDMKWKYKNLPVPKRPRHLPVVLSKESVCKIIQVTPNLKHRAILELLYTTGMRISELIDLRVGDIDSKRMQVRVLGKGDKYRLTLLSNHCLDTLRAYWQEYKPKKYLFFGHNGREQYSRSSVRRVLAKSVRLAGVKQQVIVHTLRHCFATHLLEEGINIVTVKKLLGHTSLATTMKYIHVQKSPDLNQHPFDDFL